MKKIYVTIHGICTAKRDVDWQDVFELIAQREDPTCEVVTHKYGRVLGIVSWFVSLQHALNFTQWRHEGYIKTFAERLIQIRKDNPDAEISVVAHSFGTYITYEALSHYIDVNVDNIILIAGVISCHIENLNLDEMFEDGRIKYLRSYCTHNDELIRGLIYTSPITFSFGHLGYWGFIRRGHENEDKQKPLEKPYEQLPVYNRQTEEDHSGVTDYMKVKYAMEILKYLNEKN